MKQKTRHRPDGYITEKFDLSIILDITDVIDNFDLSLAYKTI